MTEPGDAQGLTLRAALSAYWASLLALGRGRLVWTGMLVLVGALIEGMGIVLVVPLLELVFASGGGSGRAERFAGPVIEAIGPAAGLAALLGIAAVLVALRGYIAWRRTMAQTGLANDLVDSWRERLVMALVRANWREIQALIRSQMEFTIASDVGRVSIGSDRMLRGAVSVVQIVVLAGVAVALAPLLSVAILILLALSVPMMRHLSRRSFVHGTMLSREGARRHGSFTELLAGIKLAKAHDAEDRYAAEYIDASRDIRRQVLGYTAERTRAAQLFRAAGAIFAGLVLIVGLHVFHTAPAVLSALLALMVRLTGPVMQLAQGFEAMTSMLPAVVNIVSLEQRLAGTDGAKVSPARSAPPLRDRGGKGAEVRLSGVHYAHDPRGGEVLRGVDLTIGPGELVALHGRSGAGKTTLADIAIGLYAPRHGRLLVDGEAVSGAEGMRAWRREIAYVPQDPFLFDRSLGENLRWSAPDADDDEVFAALEAAEAMAFVSALPEGLATRAGDRGSRFSGGERQRLCLARALLRRPRFLVLDEPTSALDSDTEERLFQTLEKLRGSTSILLIAHRLPIDLAFDRRYSLNNGLVS